MKTGSIARTVMCAALAGLVGVNVLAEEEGGRRHRRGEGERAGKGEGRGEFRGKMEEYRKAQMEKRREFMKKQFEEDKLFREGLKDGDPKEGVVAMIAHRETQYGETTDFAGAQHKALLSFAKKTMAECEVPEDRQQELLDRIKERFAEFTEKHNEFHAKVIDTLEGLSRKEDLTWEDIREAMKSLPRPRQGGRGQRRRGGQEGGGE